ncbi:hypothetical protein D4R86_05990 [bacterium]|nr:MAG: hypothetical protein D4R86_05990 [bacterium]
MSKIKSSCSRINIRNKSTNNAIVYSRPVFSTDLKREGRFVRLINLKDSHHRQLRLDGYQINALKNILVEAGEVTLSNKWKKKRNK